MLQGHSQYAGVVLQGLVLVETDLNSGWHRMHASWLLHLRKWFSTRGDFAPTEDVWQYLDFSVVAMGGGVEGAPDI